MALALAFVAGALVGDFVFAFASAPALGGFAVDLLRTASALTLAGAGCCAGLTAAGALFGADVLAAGALRTGALSPVPPAAPAVRLIFKPC